MVTESQRTEQMTSRREFFVNCSFPVAYSLNQTVKPVAKLTPANCTHIFMVKGLRAMNLDSFTPGFTVTTITSPDSIYGCENSAYMYRSAIISVSPTAASKLCSLPKHKYLLTILMNTRK